MREQYDQHDQKTNETQRGTDGKNDAVLDMTSVPDIQEQEWEGTNAAQCNEVPCVVRRIAKRFGCENRDIGFPTTEDKEACH